MRNLVNWHSNGTRRTLTGLAIVVALAVALLLRAWTEFIFDALVIILAWVCVYEIMNAKQLDKKGVRDYYLYPYMIVAYMLFLLGILVDNPFALWLHIILQVVLMACLCLYVFFMALTDKKLEKQARLAKEDIGKAARRVTLEYLKLIVYPALMLFTLVPLNHLHRFASVTMDGFASPVPVTHIGLFAVLLVFVIPFFTDTTAQMVGRVFGGKKLAPRISPKKTISGFVGGLFGGTVGALLVLLSMSGNSEISAFFTQHIGYATASNLFIAGIGLAGALIVQMGDLYASVIKRRAGIKDFGKWLPGHGGAMDRFDGTVFIAPFISLVFMIVLLV